jgi:hypothetical protein
MQESGTAPQAKPPKEGPRAPTASEHRVETLAQHLAAMDIPEEMLAGLETDTGAQLELEKLARGYDLARPAPGEIPKILDRVREIRSQKTPPETPPSPPPKPPRARKPKSRPKGQPQASLRDFMRSPDVAA